MQIVSADINEGKEAPDEDREVQIILLYKVSGEGGGVYL